MGGTGQYRPDCFYPRAPPSGAAAPGWEWQPICKRHCNERSSLTRNATRHGLANPWTPNALDRDGLLLGSEAWCRSRRKRGRRYALYERHRCQPTVHYIFGIGGKANGRLCRPVSSKRSKMEEAACQVVGSRGLCPTPFHAQALCASTVHVLGGAFRRPFVPFRGSILGPFSGLFLA